MRKADDSKTSDLRTNTSTRLLNRKGSALQVRENNLKRAELICASHSGLGFVKLDGLEEKALIYTSAGCYIMGDRLSADKLSL